jgi:hypothetical protein
MSVSNIPPCQLKKLEIPVEPGMSWSDDLDLAVRANMTEALRAMATFLTALRKAFPITEAAPIFTVQTQGPQLEVFLGDGHTFMRVYLFRSEGAYHIEESGETLVGTWREGVAMLIREFVDDANRMTDIYAQRAASLEALESLVIGGEHPAHPPARTGGSSRADETEPHASAEA